MKTHSVGLLAAALLLTSCSGTGDGNASKQVAGVIDRFEVVSSADAYGGAMSAGAAGPYTVITGIAHGKLDPAHPDNAGIVDLKAAPQDADGKVA